MSWFPTDFQGISRARRVSQIISVCCGAKQASPPNRCHDISEDLNHHWKSGSLLDTYVMSNETLTFTWLLCLLTRYNCSFLILSIDWMHHLFVLLLQTKTQTFWLLILSNEAMSTYNPSSWTLLWTWILNSSTKERTFRGSNFSQDLSKTFNPFNPSWLSWEPLGGPSPQIGNHWTK